MLLQERTHPHGQRSQPLSHRRTTMSLQQAALIEGPTIPKPTVTRGARSVENSTDHKFPLTTYKDSIHCAQPSVPLAKLSVPSNAHNAHSQSSNGIRAQHNTLSNKSPHNHPSLFHPATTHSQSISPRLSFQAPQQRCRHRINRGSCSSQQIHQTPHPLAVKRCTLQHSNNRPLKGHHTSKGLHCQCTANMEHPIHPMADSVPHPTTLSLSLPEASPTTAQHLP